MRMVKLTDLSGFPVWINCDRITYLFTGSYVDRTIILFSESSEVAVKESPERILKAADDDLRKYESRKVSKHQVNKATETLLKGF